MKTKPRKIVVEERDENDEMVRRIVEKARKLKVTALKKAILKKRERENRRAAVLKQVQSGERPLPREGSKDDGGLSSGYVTIDEANDNLEAPAELIKQTSHIAKPTLIKNRGLPYTAIFRDLDGLLSKVEEELLQGFTRQNDLL